VASAARQVSETDSDAAAQTAHGECAPGKHPT
jgi:hypothetical protein